MFSGAQISLYPMTDDFVGVITSALGALDPYRERLRIETDDISTLLVGPPEVLFPALRDLFTAAARTGVHCVLSAAISRGCPGEPDDAICQSAHFDGPLLPLAERQSTALSAVREAPMTDVFSVAQFSLYGIGTWTRSMVASSSSRHRASSKAQSTLQRSSAAIPARFLPRSNRPSAASARLRGMSRSI